MTTTFTFGKTNNKNNNSFQFNNSTNYSKVLDNIILADIADKNSYLFKNYKEDYLDDLILNAKPAYKSINIDDDFSKAIYFLTNYNKKKSYKLPFKLNTTYTLSDGTPIIFYDDEIQIGFDVYKYSAFNDFSFLNKLNDNTKKIIINIYTTGASKININLL